MSVGDNSGIVISKFESWDVVLDGVDKGRQIYVEPRRIFDNPENKFTPPNVKTQTAPSTPMKPSKAISPHPLIQEEGYLQ